MIGTYKKHLVVLYAMSVINKLHSGSQRLLDNLQLLDFVVKRTGTTGIHTPSWTSY